MKKKILWLIVAGLLALQGAACAESAGGFNYDTGKTATQAPAAQDADFSYPIAREILEDADDVLRLVNKAFPLEKGYPDESTLVKATVRKASTSEMKLRGVANEAMQQMFDAAEAEGIDLYLSSAYRSYRTQEVMYYNRLQQNNGKDDGLVQKEGASDHQTGLGADIISKAWIGSKFNAKFAQTSEAQWMAENCARFGFIIRYPEGKEDITDIAYEPWHLRYVGVDVAQYMTEKGYTLEEFTEEYQAALSGELTLPQTVATEETPEPEVTVDSFNF